ncbi:MAG TPA: glycosyltransferase, partial [Nitrososphaeraceae archaeon]|nr:glycosyltransferase [Nitrososphaeraceae archaeon]
LPIVSTSTCEIPNIFKHGHDALLSNDANELRQYCLQLLGDSKLRETLGNNARETVKNRFTIEKFKNKWNEIFDKLVGA